MADIKISEMLEAEEIGQNDFVPIIQSGINKKAKATLFGTGGGTTNTTVVYDRVPVGAVMEYASENIPANWLLCNGQAVSRTDYVELFQIIGTTFGSGDGATTFNLPDYRGRVGVGKSSDTDFNELGKKGGEKTHILTTNETPSHSHPITIVGTGTGRYGYNVETMEIGSSQTEKTGSTGGGEPHNNLQPYVVSNYIIKVRKESEEKNPMKCLFKGTCEVGSSVELNEDPLNFKTFFFRIGSNVTFPMCILHPERNAALRAVQSMAIDDGIQVYSVSGTLSGKTFNLVNTQIMTMKATGITKNNSGAISEIWGIR